MILVDTWAWVALAVKRDQFHTVAKARWCPSSIAKISDGIVNIIYLSDAGER